ncbi:MAG: nitrous oxide reductase, partial [Ignavibacteria bacterium]|nr:nitrous oxide reductase [Ignavibacteria bacterium]
LGPLHTEFDDKGYAYTSMFVSSEVVKWDVKKLEVIDRAASFYSVGHIMIPGGDSRKPWGKYLVVMNKITKDRFLPTGPELTQSAQLYDISGDRMKLLLDFPTVGEPHYAQGIKADVISGNSLKIYKLAENEHPYAVKSINDIKVERKGNEVHIWGATIRSHFEPDNIEGIKEGDVVYFHITNLEQDWDIPHGFAIIGAENAEMLIMPGETQTLKWEPKNAWVYPFYCTDFCSALHQEMQGYIRVQPKNSTAEIKFYTGKK